MFLPINEIKTWREKTFFNWFQIWINARSVYTICGFFYFFRVLYYKYYEYWEYYIEFREKNIDWVIIFTSTMSMTSRFIIH